MRTIEFKSKVKDQYIHIPKKVQEELKDAVGKNVRVIIFIDDSDDQDIGKLINEEQSTDLLQEQLESINRGLNDFKEGRIHSHESVRKLYEKYL